MTHDLKTIIFLGQEQVNAFLPDVDDVCISIATPGWPQPQLKEGWLEVLSLAFHDVDPDDMAAAKLIQNDMDVVFFHPEQAKKMAQFAKKHENTRRIVVHCYAGISRSAAVARVIGTQQNRLMPGWDYDRYANHYVEKLLTEAFEQLE